MTLTKTVLRGASLTAAFALFASTAFANDILTIKGIDKSGQETTQTFTLEDLDTFETTEFSTANDYIETVATFSGPLLRDVIAEYELPEDGTITMTALNDYAINMPIEDIMNYDVILSTRLNGKEMSVREKGPIWVMYPVDDNPELALPSINGRMIWQLDEINVR
ncbi:molybdopterin-dependent oxidoreductase [Alphaproteobacteria bacterium KMM 3653]|uniref:Molybdopterin-dependent oxidoreductase n=1 Tax=Harenicola maris TaxID=2841044 RepID=A0AAP2CP26_9RHOB|nr:molybdopterin-dependent oxidoreductase [Harenicola maris]